MLKSPNNNVSTLYAAACRYTTSHLGGKGIFVEGGAKNGAVYVTLHIVKSVSYTHLTLPTKRIV